MTKAEFRELPGLVQENQILALGIVRSTFEKYVDCGILTKFKPSGCGQNRYRKKQIALLLNWEAINQADAELFRREPMVMTLKTVMRWTGYREETLAKIVDAGGLHPIKPAGSEQAKYHKEEIAKWLGWEHCV